MMQVDHVFNRLLYSLLPARCVLCQSAGLPSLDICALCLAELSKTPRPLATAYGTVYAAFAYQAPLDALIHGFKFKQQLHYGRLLANLAWRGIPPKRPDALLPVPLHRSRLRERGFNQSLELAKFWSRKWAIPRDDNALIRHRATAAQSTLSAALRHENVREAFSARTALPHHVALVDDVLTTGATYHAAANALIAQGVQRVDVWCLARVL